MSARGAFSKHFGMLLLYGSLTIIVSLFLMFGLIMPLFQQLFGELVYIQPETVWIFGLVAILFTFGISMLFSILYASRLGGRQTIQLRGP